MRILGLDFGSKTVGVAVSDPLGITAQPVEIVRRKSESKLRQTLARIEELAKEYRAESFVLGLPKNMNNTMGERAEKSLAMWDERLTTVAANRAMMEGGVRRENRGEYVDPMAAALILQGYLDSLKNSANNSDTAQAEDEE